MEVLANRLKWLREKKRLGQKEVASEIGVTLSGYQKMEYNQAKPKLETLVKLAQYFKVTSDFLLGLTDNVDDLGLLADEFYTLRTRKEMLRKELEVLNYQLHDVYSKKGIPIQTLEYTIEMDAKENILSRRKTSSEQELYTIQEKYRKTIFNYIEALFEIPDSNALINPIIKLLTPFSIEIQPNIFDEFSLALFCNEGFIGNYGAYKTEEESLEVRKVLLTMLNSRN
jgi:transcriptional regulator with XRE-family HTH domain